MHYCTTPLLSLPFVQYAVSCMELDTYTKSEIFKDIFTLMWWSEIMIKEEKHSQCDDQLGVMGGELYLFQKEESISSPDLLQSK